MECYFRKINRAERNIQLICNLSWFTHIPKSQLNNCKHLEEILRKQTYVGVTGQNIMPSTSLLHGV